MDMKKMLTILSESKQVNECGDMMNSSVPSTPPVSMSVNLNAQGIDQIKDLLNLMNKAEGALAPGLVGQGPAPMAMPMPEPKPMPMAMPIGMDKPEEPKEPDMKDLIKIASEPGPEPEKSGEEPAGKKEMQDVASDVKGLADELKNSPAGTGMNEPTYGDLDAAVPSGDDLHKQKGTYPKVAGGDNPMQRMEGIKSSLSSLYKEIKETR
jgi:hypothetical protein